MSIVGAGGIGKTTVAWAVAEQMRPELVDESIYFVDLGAISEAGLLLGAVASTIGCTLGGPVPVEELLSFIASKRMLILLDSCEHLLESTSLLAGKLFNGAPQLSLLVTSREPLRVEGETVHFLRPLDCPMEKSPTAAEAMTAPAVQLFMHWASLSGFAGELSDTDAPLVAEVCRRSDGIALAIELAASRVGTYGIRGVAELLSNNSELTMVGRRDATPRHWTLQSMLDWSFKLLDDDEQRVLARLSVFVGLFTIEAACSVVGGEGRDQNATAALLAGLVDKSLVWSHPSSDPLFRLPDTTRAYASRKLAEIEDAEITYQRHALYFSKLLTELATESTQHVDLRRYAPHIGNVRKALEWSFLDKSRHDSGVAMAANAAALFLGLWLFDECRRWTLAALAAIDSASDVSEQEGRLQEALALSSMHARGNSEEVRAALERALNLSQPKTNVSPQLRLLAGLEIFLTRRGDFEGAITAAKRFSSIARRGGSRRDQAIGDWILGAAYLAEDQTASLNHYERGFQLAADVSDLDVDLFGYNHHIRAMTGRARALWNRGFPESACEQARQVMEEAPRHHPTNYCIGVLYSVPVLLWSGNVEGSWPHIKSALAYAEKYLLAPYAGVALTLLGERLVMTGNLSTGVDTLRQGLKILIRENHHVVTSSAFRALAEGLVRCGEHVEANATINAAISSAHQMRHNMWLSELYRTQGEIILKTPCADLDAAEAALLTSINLARQQAALGWELKAAIPLAALLLKRGHRSEAHGLLRPLYEAFAEKSGSADLLAAGDILAVLS